MDTEISMPLSDAEFRRKVQHDRAALGAFSEFIVAADLSRHGYIVSFPSATMVKYDLVVDTGEELLRVQVKTMTLNKMQIPTGTFKNRDFTPADYRNWKTPPRRKTVRKYSTRDFDILAGVDRNTRICYYVDMSSLDLSKGYFTLDTDNLEQYYAI